LSSDCDELSSLLSGSRLAGGGGWSRALSSSRGWAGSTVELGDELVSEQVDDELEGRRLHGEFEILLEGILVLLEPSNDFVLDSTGVMSETEVVLAETRLLVERVALVVLVKLGEEGVIVGLGHDTLFVEKDEDTVGTLVDEIDGGLRVKTEIDEGPVYLFLQVLLLFELEHVVIEELLQLLVGVVNANLLEAVLLENFETSNIEDTDEGVETLLVEDLVGTLDDPQEETTVDGL